MTTAATLDARYGRTPRRRRRSVLVAVIAGIGVVVTVVAWVIWAGLLSPAADLETRDLGFSIPDDEHVVVTWELTVSPGTNTSCAVQALDEQHGIVGWRVVDLAASEQRTRAFDLSLRTSAPPVTGLIYRCWLT